jgi:hypothetical protein
MQKHLIPLYVNCKYFSVFLSSPIGFNSNIAFRGLGFYYSGLNFVMKINRQPTHKTACELYDM